MTTALEFKNVDILFAPGDGRRAAQLIAKALTTLDGGATRADIAKDTGVVVGVAGANLSVERGEISVLMGLSGSGKSTLLRAANGLNRVTRGSVLVHAAQGVVDVASCDEATLRAVRRRAVAMVFQQFGLLPWRTVRDNVGFGLELRGDSEPDRLRIVDEKLELVGLSQWADRHVAELSGGMQQRVGLARAFATDADILLMDEPFSALDPLIRAKLQDELLLLQERVKKTIVFVSHDLDEALKLGDHITMLQGGRIVQSGTSTDIVLRPADAYVAEFVQHMNPLNVLDGGMIMRRAEELMAGGGIAWRDGHSEYAVELADGRPGGVRCDGAAQTLVSLGDADQPVVAGAMAMVPAESSLRSLVRLCRNSGRPVLLAEAERVVGICGPAEIIRALAGERGTGAGRH
jgi:glycine betaine/proline transport system ATP-binding protein